MIRRVHPLLRGRQQTVGRREPNPLFVDIFVSLLQRLSLIRSAQRKQTARVAEASALPSQSQQRPVGICMRENELAGQLLRRTGVYKKCRRQLEADGADGRITSFRRGSQRGAKIPKCNYHRPSSVKLLLHESR